MDDWVKDEFVRGEGSHIQLENLEQRLHQVDVQHDDLQVFLFPLFSYV